MSLIGATSMSLIFFLDLSLSEAWDKRNTYSNFPSSKPKFKWGKQGYMLFINKLHRIIKKQYKFASFSNTHFQKNRKLLTELLKPQTTCTQLKETDKCRLPIKHMALMTS